MLQINNLFGGFSPTRAYVVLIIHFLRRAVYEQQGKKDAHLAVILCTGYVMTLQQVFIILFVNYFLVRNVVCA